MRQLELREKQLYEERNKGVQTSILHQAAMSTSMARPEHVQITHGQDTEGGGGVTPKITGTELVMAGAGVSTTLVGNPNLNPNQSKNQNSTQNRNQIAIPTTNQVQNLNQNRDQTQKPVQNLTQNQSQSQTQTHSTPMGMGAGASSGGNDNIPAMIQQFGIMLQGLMDSKDNKEKKEDKIKCKGLEDGKCIHGWKGRQNGKCKFHHPDVCKVSEVLKVPCTDTDCDKHHPNDCITMEKDEICIDRYCLRRHHPWSYWASNTLPRIPDAGGWDGWDFKPPSKELKRMWRKKDENEEKEREKEREREKAEENEREKRRREKEEEERKERDRRDTEEYREGDREPPRGFGRQGGTNRGAIVTT